MEVAQFGIDVVLIEPGPVKAETGEFARRYPRPGQTPGASTTVISTVLADGPVRPEARYRHSMGRAGTVIRPVTYALRCNAGSHE